MYTLTSEITIEGNRFSSVADITVKRSISELMATAKIKLPTTAVLKQALEPPTTVDVAQQIKKGNKVEIRFGYDGKNNLEFRGYVKQLSLTTPLVVECEDEFYMCRKRKVTTSGTTTLSELLQKCGLQVAYAEELTLKNFVIDNRSVAFVLSKLQTDYGLSIYFDLEGRINASRKSYLYGDKVNYEFRRNVISDDNLKQNEREEDDKIEVKAVSYLKDGTKIEATAGESGGTSKTVYFYGVESESELKPLAESELQQVAAGGYTGDITTFLLPNVKPCDLAVVTDKVYPQRDGTYYIESISTSFGRSGGRRTVAIGQKYDTRDKKAIQ